MNLYFTQLASCVCMGASDIMQARIRTAMNASCTCFCTHQQQDMAITCASRETCQFWGVVDSVDARRMALTREAVTKAKGEVRFFLTSFFGESVGEVRRFWSGLLVKVEIRIEASRWLALRREQAVKFCCLRPDCP